MSLPSRVVRHAAIAFAVAMTAALPSVPAAADATTPTASHAASKQTDHATNTWGAFPGGANIAVWTEVRLSNGQWSRSQTGTTDTNGRFVLPLTYGLGSVGEFQYRVGGQYPDGRIAYTEPFTIVRLAKPSAYSAAERHVGVVSNTWGNAQSTGVEEVWTEVRLSNGAWSRSQIRETSSTGNFVIPLTYGEDQRGEYTYRVAAEHPDGTVVRSDPFEIDRFGGEVHAAAASTKVQGEGANTWGSFLDGAEIPVWTEVKLSNGSWSRSQTSVSRSDGSFVIPLTYSRDLVGTYTYRVGGKYPDGHVAYSEPFAQKRTARVVAPTTGSGTKYDWMRAAGIPQSQWQYADYIVSRESSWNPRAVNPYSGACGLAQAYPCSKLGPNWYDPVVALKWQYNYVTERYGGYQGAYNFWVRNRWY